MAVSEMNIELLRRKVIIGFVFAVLAVGLTIGGCAHQNQNSDVSIGAILPLSGDNASFGTTARGAYRIAEQDAAKMGLPKIRLVYGDSKLDKDLALKEFRRLVDVDKVVGLVEVTGSGVAISLAPIAARDQVLILSGIDSSPDLTEKGGAYFFRVIPSDAYSGKVLSEWTVGSGLSRAALVYN